MIKKTLIGLVLISLFQYSYGQVDQEARYESEIKTNHNFTLVETAFNPGPVLLTQFSGKIQKHYEIIKLDSSLEERWKRNIYASPTFELIKQTSYQDQVYYLLFDEKTSNLELWEITASNGDFRRKIIKNNVAFEITFFEVYSRGILIGGSTPEWPVIIFIEHNSSDRLYLSNNIKKPGYLTDLHVDPMGNIMASTVNYHEDKSQPLEITFFDSKGFFLNTINIEPNDGESFLEAKLVASPDKTIISGTYGKAGKASATGIFIADVETSRSEIKYYPLTSFFNFLNYKDEFSAQTIRRRINRKRLAGKEIDFQENVLLQDLEIYNDEIVLSGFVANYNYEIYLDEAVYTSTSFDGAFLLGIGKDGEPKWDNMMDMHRLKAYSANDVLELNKNKNTYDMLYASETKIHFKKIQSQRTTHDQDSENIKSKSIHDRIIQDSGSYYLSQVIYDKVEECYYIYGEQTIFNTLKTRTKKVFYINKVIYR